MSPFLPPPPPYIPLPTLAIRVDDLEHPGADIFFDAVHPKTALRQAVAATLNHLYSPRTTPTNVKQILLVLRKMDGVAVTFGSHSHKEIHFSLDHIQRSQSRAKAEIMGVLVHEAVHCFQYNASNTCPGGLIEGIADFVRLRESLSPPHWKRVPGETWDVGYEKTAYFLDWIEQRYGDGTIRDLNLCLKEGRYHRRVFRHVTGRPVRKLWAMYCKSLEDVPAEDASVLSYI